MRFRLQPVSVAVGDDGEGRLLFADERLAAVLVRLSAMHGDDAGRWFLEAGFGGFEDPGHPTFPDLDSALRWAAGRLAQRFQREAAARGPS